MMTSDLAQMKCVPCHKGTPRLSIDEVTKLLNLLEPGWAVEDNHHLIREFHFRNFREVLDFTNRVGELAELEGHHPDIYLAWGLARVSIWTHAINGLSVNDFILAAKIGKLKGI